MELFVSCSCSDLVALMFSSSRSVCLASLLSFFSLEVGSSVGTIA